MPNGSTGTTVSALQEKVCTIEHYDKTGNSVDAVCCSDKNLVVNTSVSLKGNCSLDWEEIISQFAEQVNDGAAKHIVCLIQVDDMVEFEEAENFTKAKPAPISAIFVLVRSTASAEDQELDEACETIVSANKNAVFSYMWDSEGE